jgi:UDP-3-O-[3-hydroxymyristoyl] glucosamine N-acyltransferase
VKQLTLGQIAALLQCPPPPGPSADILIGGVAALEEARATDLSLLKSKGYLKQFAATSAAAVLVDRSIKPRPIAAGARPALLLVDDAELAMARILQEFAPPVPRPPAGVDPSSRVDPSVEIGEAAAVGPFAVVGARCRIGRNAILHAGVCIGDDVTIGDDCQLFPHVVVRERITIGHRVVIHANSVLGTDGFGYRWDGASHAKVPQIGTVIIEDDVEIGSCVCIDRAKFGATRVGHGSKIDNLVQIAHNVVIGPHCIIVGQVGLAGGVRLGTGVVLGGQVAVRDHVTLGDGAAAAACAGIAEDVEARTVVSGIPAFPHRQSLREQAALRRLPDLIQQVRKLQEEIDSLRGK